MSFHWDYVQETCCQVRVLRGTGPLGEGDWIDDSPRRGHEVQIADSMNHSECSRSIFLPNRARKNHEVLVHKPSQMCVTADLSSIKSLVPFLYKTSELHQYAEHVGRRRILF